MSRPCSPWLVTWWDETAEKSALMSYSEWGKQFWLCVTQVGTLTPNCYHQSRTLSFVLEIYRSHPKSHIVIGHDLPLKFQLLSKHRPLPSTDGNGRIDKSELQLVLKVASQAVKSNHDLLRESRDDIIRWMNPRQSPELLLLLFIDWVRWLGSHRLYF